MQAGAYLDSVREIGLSTETLQCKVASLKCLGRLISDPATRYGIDVLNGVVALLLFESMTPNNEQCRLQSRAIIRVLSNRTGIGCLSDHINVALAIVTSKTQLAYLDDLQLAPTGIEEARVWKREVDFLVNTLRRLSEWVLQTRSAFHPVDEFEFSYQMLILSYLSLVLCEWHNQANCTNLLQTMSARHSKLNFSRSCSNAVWFCIQGMDGKWDLQFQAIRLIRVFHRLSGVMQSRLKGFLTGLCGVVTGSAPVIVLSEDDYITISQEALAST